MHCMCLGSCSLLCPNSIVVQTRVTGSAGIKHKQNSLEEFALHLVYWHWLAHMLHPLVSKIRFALSSQYSALVGFCSSFVQTISIYCLPVRDSIPFTIKPCGSIYSDLFQQKNYYICSCGHTASHTFEPNGQ